MKRYAKLLTISLAMIACVGLLYYLGVHEYFSLAWLQAKSGEFMQAVNDNYLKTVLIYMAIFICIVMVTLPVFIPLTLIGGFLFGTVLGALYAAISVVIGSVISFILFRYAFGASLRRKFARRFELFNGYFKKYGISYLLILHYSSVIPLFIINTCAALSDMSLKTFMGVTLAGSLPVCLVYAFAGQQFSSIQSASDIFSPAVIAALALLILLACIPIIVRWAKPSSFEI